jgi:hypothetical protein
VFKANGRSREWKFGKSGKGGEEKARGTKEKIRIGTGF